MRSGRRLARLVSAAQKFLKGEFFSASGKHPKHFLNRIRKISKHPRSYDDLSLQSKPSRLGLAHELILGKVLKKLDVDEKTIFAKWFPVVQHLEKSSLEQSPSEKSSLEQSPSEESPSEKSSLEQSPLEQSPLEQSPLEESSPAYRKTMRSYIQFLTTPTADTPGTSLLLHFDDKRYVIGNIHEGIQRAGIQVGARFTRVHDIFVTGKTEWKTTGGLLGLVITLADSTHAASVSLAEAARQKLESQSKGAGKSPPHPSASDIVVSKPVMNVHGGPNLMHLFATARKFIFRKGVPLRVYEAEGHEHDTVNVDREPDWADVNIQVWNMAIPNSAVASSPKSPRKRSFTEFSDHLDQKEKDQEIRRHIVSEMFESSWYRDQLEEIPLSQVPGLETAMYVRDTQAKKFQRYFPPSGDDGTPLPNINVFVRKAWPGALIDGLPRCKPSPIAMSYIIRGHRRRGKFLPLKAKELGVPPGPSFARLTKGESVQSQDGKTITPDMVMEKDKDGGGVAVIDLPSKEYVENLINRPEWNSETIMAGVGALIWLLGPGVGQDPQIRTFMTSHPQWKHIISSPDSCPNYLAMSSSASSAIRLSRINSNFFPIPFYDNNVRSQHDNPIDEKLSAAGVVASQRGLICQLEPTFEVQDNAVYPFLGGETALKTVPQKALDLAQLANQAVVNEFSNSKVTHLPGGDAEIITLGTGSALPSKYRNVSATLLRVPGSGSYLLDCGENTLGQLRRVYGDEGLKEVLQDLKLIWISHLHADHHLGIVSVIKAWRDEVHGWEGVQNVTQSPDQSELTSLFSSIAETPNPVNVLEKENRLVVVSTAQMMDWLKEYAGVEDFGLDKTIPLESVATWSAKSPRFHLKWHHRHVGFSPHYPKINDALKKATGLSDLVACQVPHCYNAQAVSLTFPTGFKFSYSGDCRPCEEFVRIGKGSTVLLHEATFDDELQGDAQAKKHSTTSEAIGVGMAMGARRIVLTHFSQRYQKIPVMEDMGFIGVKLQMMEQTEESDIPSMDTEMADLPTRAHQDSSAPQSSDTTETNSTLGNVVSNVPSGITEAASLHSMGSPKSPRKAAFSTPADSKSKVSGAAIPSTVNDMKVCVAFDYMRVKVKDIAHMEKYAPALLELYQQDGSEDKDDEQTLSLQQITDERKIKGKRKDESDDEDSQKKDKKKSNERINRGKVKKLSHKDKSENEKTEERKTQSKEEQDQKGASGEEKDREDVDQGERDKRKSGKGAADTNAMLLDAQEVFSTELPLEDHESENNVTDDKIEVKVPNITSKPENTELMNRYDDPCNQWYNWLGSSFETDSSPIESTSTDPSHMRVYVSPENPIEVEAQRQGKLNVVPTNMEVMADKAELVQAMLLDDHSEWNSRTLSTTRLKRTENGLSKRQKSISEQFLEKRKKMESLSSLRAKRTKLNILQEVPPLRISRTKDHDWVHIRRYPSTSKLIRRYPSGSPQPIPDSSDTEREAPAEEPSILESSQDLNQSQEQSNQENSIKKVADTHPSKSLVPYPRSRKSIKDYQISPLLQRIKAFDSRITWREASAKECSILKSSEGLNRLQEQSDQEDPIKKLVRIYLSTLLVRRLEVKHNSASSQTRNLTPKSRNKSKHLKPISKEANSPRRSKSAAVPQVWRLEFKKTPTSDPTQTLVKISMPESLNKSEKDVKQLNSINSLMESSRPTSEDENPLQRSASTPSLHGPQTTKQRKSDKSAEFGWDAILSRVAESVKVDMVDADRLARLKEKPGISVRREESIHAM